MSRNTPIRTAVAFVAATLLAYLVIVAGWIAYADRAHVADNDGGVGMAVVFVYAPIGAILTGVGAALIFGGTRASHQVKAAAGVIALLVLARAILMLVGI